MIKLTFLFFVSSMLLQADTKLETYKLYQDAKYEEACQKGEGILEEYKDDEEFISLYAFACLNADHLDKLSMPITALKKSKEARANAAYFSVILMQKKLLMYSLSDRYDLKPVKLPTTDYVLSTVFDLYAKDTSPKDRRRYNYRDPNDAKKSYRLFVTKSAPSPKMVIEEYYDKIMTQRHIYW
ncbi:hypothetical protein [Sulfurimonas sp. HSL3-7]|uniref:hypothetical protein n=1 Tax=Sulfonitrofixus jiaomeiensis TaxID=3131938 RepID=UPI0031F8BE0D